MEGQKPETGSVSEYEARFLGRLAQKYAGGEDTGAVRSYAIMTASFVVLFVAARWIPWWPVALVATVAAGLFAYSKYKKFSRFQTRILVKLWRERSGAKKG